MRSSRRPRVRQARDLQESRVGSQYAADLRAAYWAFRRFIAREGGNPLRLGRSARFANDWLIRYIQSLHDAPAGRIKDARYAILGVQLVHRHNKGALRVAWDSVKSWQLESPGRHRVPIPEDLMEAASNLCFIMGFVAEPGEARYWVPLGVLIRAGFHGLLRPSEIYALATDGIALTSSRIRKTRHGAILTIRDPKNRRSMGRNQFTIVDDELTTRWLSWLVEGLPGGVKLFPSTPDRARSLLKRVFDILGMSLTGFTFGSLRSGGATARYIRDRNIPALRSQGRWKGESSMEPYLQEAVCELVAADLGDAAPLVDGLRSLNALFSSAPSHPWQSFFSRNRQLAGLLRWRTRMAESASHWHDRFGVSPHSNRLK